MKTSVAMAVYNGEKYIREQLDSILSGEMVPDEIVISDDASTDGTVQIVEEYLDRCSNTSKTVIKLLHSETNQGFAENFKKAIGSCSGDIILLSDQDDIWEPRKLLLISRVMKKRKEIKVLGTSFILIDKDGRTIEDYMKLPEADIEEGRRLYPELFEKPRRGWSNNNLFRRAMSENALVEVMPEEIMFHNICQGACLAFRGNIKQDILGNIRTDIPHDWQIALIGAGMSGFYFYNKKLIRYRLHEANAVGLGLDGDNLSEEYRMKEAVDALKAVKLYISFIKHTHYNYNLKQQSDENIAEDGITAEMQGDASVQYAVRAERFLLSYLDAMKRKDRKLMMKLAVDPFFAKLKLPRGRVGDMIFIMKKTK